MVLTGDEQGLSAPVSLDSSNSQSLPFERDDITNVANVIHVSPRTAVRSIADLQWKEEEAFSDLGTQSTDKSIDSIIDNMCFGLISADERVDEIMQKAEEKVANNMSEVKYVAHQMEAER